MLIQKKEPQKLKGSKWLAKVLVFAGESVEIYQDQLKQARKTCKKQMITNSVKSMSIIKPSEDSNSSKIGEYEDKLLSTTTGDKQDEMSV